MKTLLTYAMTVIVALGLPSRGAAQISLTLEPSPQSISVGDSASMDLVVSGLGNLSAPSLGGFDFDLTYDSTIISANSLTFGSFLDLGIGSLQFSDLATAGAIHLDEVSFESSTDLNNTQPDSFTLATLGFTGLAAGISAIDFSFASLSDEQAQSLTAFSTTGGTIEVTRLTGIPDLGSTASLLLLGIVSLWGLQRFPQAARGNQRTA
jgi:hypothetical protein